ncbi:MAG: serine/threonine-protein kinase [Planctomycetota bacterium]
MPTDPASFSDQIRILFASALQLPADQRDAFLDRECDDPALREQVADLLQHYDERLSLFSTDAVPAGLAAGPRPQHIGGYAIQEVLGAGGMGVVYRARQVQPQRDVALKVLQAQAMHADARARFAREAEVLARLTHPGIAQIYDVGTFDAGYGEQPFFAMELVDGDPLTDYARRRRLGTGDRCKLIAAICDAVQHAHERGVIHRDFAMTSPWHRGTARG